jgi:hypothetical protein
VVNGMIAHAGLVFEHRPIANAIADGRHVTLLRATTRCGVSICPTVRRLGCSHAGSQADDGGDQGKR